MLLKYCVTSLLNSPLLLMTKVYVPLCCYVIGVSRVSLRVVAFHLISHKTRHTELHGPELQQSNNRRQTRYDI